MSCCEPQSRKDFLNSKLANFRMYLAPYCTTEELKQRLTEYNNMDTVMPFLLQAIALKQVGQLDTSVQSFCDAFPVPTEWPVGTGGLRVPGPQAPQNSTL